MSIVSELEELLQQEQELLLSGRFAELELLCEHKSRLAHRLACSKPELPKEIYANLAERAVHNEALLDSARRGLQSAMTQLRQIAQAEDQSTYSKDGQRRPLSRKPATVTQKL